MKLKGQYTGTIAFASEPDYFQSDHVDEAILRQDESGLLQLAFDFRSKGYSYSCLLDQRVDKWDGRWSVRQGETGRLYGTLLYSEQFVLFSGKWEEEDLLLECFIELRSR